MLFGSPNPRPRGVPLNTLEELNGRYERLPTLAADLVSRRVSVIVSVGGTVVALAAKTSTTAIPIVFVIGDDPG